MKEADEVLMRKYVERQDNDAFRALFDRYAARLHAWFLRDTGSEEIASDLVQTTFLHVHRARHDFDLNRKLRPWLFAIGANARREYGRRKARRPEAAFDPDRHDTGVAPDASTPEQRLVRRAVEQLPENQRSVVLLRWYSGLSFAEIADILGVSLSAARVRAHRATRALRTLLGVYDA